MRVFTMHLQSATQYERIENVASFVGEDESGSLGIRARHARMMTALTYGLARYQLRDGGWRYLAFPRGILYFVNNALYISTRSRNMNLKNSVDGFVGANKFAPTEAA